MQNFISSKRKQYHDIQSLSGVAGTLKQPLSFKQMRKIVHEDRLKERYSALTAQTKTKKIYSYDHDFDKLEGIVRKEP